MKPYMKKTVALGTLVLATLFIVTKCCIYTSIAAFVVLSAVGFNPVYCIAEVEGCDHYHAYVRTGDTNIDPSTLNMYQSPAVDYDNPVVILNTTSEFVDTVDMSSPVR